MRPAWAENLPDRDTLMYVNALLGATLLSVGFAYVAVAVIRDPSNIGRIGRKQIGA